MLSDNDDLDNRLKELLSSDNADLSAAMLPGVETSSENSDEECPTKKSKVAKESSDELEDSDELEGNKEDDIICRVCGAMPCKWQENGIRAVQHVLNDADWQPEPTEDKEKEETTISDNDAEVESQMSESEKKMSPKS